MVDLRQPTFVEQFIELRGISLNDIDVGNVLKPGLQPAAQSGIEFDHQEPGVRLDPFDNLGSDPVPAPSSTMHFALSQLIPSMIFRAM
jgi:hypothetical protein